jgi:hypothetical protein
MVGVIDLMLADLSKGAFPIRRMMQKGGLFPWIWPWQSPGSPRKGEFLGWMARNK